MTLYSAGRRRCSSSTLPCYLRSLRSVFPSPKAAAMSTRSLFKKDQPVHWIIDWDGTITKKDTLDALVKTSATARPSSPTMDRWQHVSQAYMDDYNATLKQLVPDGALPTTVGEEKWLLSKLRDVEQRSLDRVNLSGIFAGLTQQVIEAGARHAIQAGQVQLRNGFSSFFEHIQSREADAFAILSVNWSRHFIHSCLGATGVAMASHTIVSNELDGISTGEPSTGRIVSASTGNQDLVVSSGDKLRKFEQMQQAGALKVYIGDSWTDIECLLAADLGVCIRDEPMGSSQNTLAQAFERLGVTCTRLKDWRPRSEPAVVWIKDFTEILNWIETTL